MQEISIYSKGKCPNCDILKQLLEKENIRYKEIDMVTPETLTELRMNDVFAMSAPVLQIGKKFYTTKELCIQDKIDPNKVKNVLNDI